MKHVLNLAGGLTFAAVIAVSPSAHAQGVSDQLEQLFKNAGPGCTETVKVNLMDAIRSGIDTEVKRHEAALQKPPAIDQLGCLDDLFSLNLDFAIPVPDLAGMFDAALSDAEQQICGYAQEAWNKVTEPLNAALQLPSFNNLDIPNFGPGSGGMIEYNAPSVGLGQGNYGDTSTEGRNPGEGGMLDELYQNLYGPGAQ